MPIYEITQDKLKKIQATSFNEAGIRERADLQRLLRHQIEIVAPDVLIIAEEFGDWEDSRRRIDLLGIDTDANIVVIELKRTEDGGHMELQALRYAAMISTLTFEKAVEIYREYLQSIDSELDAGREILEFLNWTEPDAELFAQDVRIVLASAEFSKEVTSSVLWLNEYGLDIRCVRFKPYNDNGRVLINVEQIIPLPEASEYQIQVSAKAQEKRSARTSAKDYSKFDVSFGSNTETNLPKRKAIFVIAVGLCKAGVIPEKISELIHWRSNRIFYSVDGVVSPEEFIAKATVDSKAIKKTFDERRWFLGDGELVQSNGRTYAFSSQWGFRTKEAMNVLINAFPEMKISFKENKVE